MSQNNATKPWKQNNESWDSYNERYNRWRQQEELIEATRLSSRNQPIRETVYINNGSDVNPEAIDSNFQQVGKLIDGIYNEIDVVKRQMNGRFKIYEDLIEEHESTKTQTINDIYKYISMIKCYLAENDPETFNEIEKEYDKKYRESKV